MALVLVVSMSNHGHPRGNYNAGSALFGIIVEALVLWWGGFWS